MDLSNNWEELDRINLELKSFSRRFYVNELLQGLAVFLMGTAVLALILSVGEFLLRSESGIRQTLFYAFTALEMLGISYLVVLPALKIYGKAGAMSKKELSLLVGQRVKEIDDKLLNVLVLSEMQSAHNINLVRAAIRQKSDDVMRIPFHKSANVKRGIRFMQGAGLVLLLLIVTGLSFPQIVDYGTKRIIYYDENIEPPAPFHFIYNSSEIKAVLNEPLEIDFGIEGDMLPKLVFIDIERNREPAIKKSFNTFGYTVQRVKGDFNFRIYAEGYSSEIIHVTAIERPSIKEFKVRLEYPPYLKQDNEELWNIGNHTVPDGTKLTWSVESGQQDVVRFDFGDGHKAIFPEGGYAVYDSTFRSDATYLLSISNTNGLSSDSIQYKIEVSPDAYPEIEVGEGRDSLNNVSRFTGRYSDDHGISQFRLGYYKGEDRKLEYRDIAFVPGELTRDFMYEIDWNNWEIEQGDNVRCFFEVWDNDGVNGKKFTRSREFNFEVPNQQALKGKRQDLTKQIEKELENAIDESRELNEEIEKLRKDLVQKKELDWSDKKKIEDLLRRNEDLKQKMNQIEEKNARKNSFEDKLSASPELQEKRKELQRLMEEILDEETLEKIKELESLMDKISKEKLNNEMEDMEMSSDLLEKELERTLELFKQLEFETKLEESIKEIEKLQKDQDELKEDIDNEGIGEEEKKEQQELDERFKEWEKEFSELHEKNQDLENKHDLEKFEEEQKEVEESMQDAMENMEKNQKKKASENQKKSSDNMESIKKGMMALQSQMKEKSMEDLQSLRNTLENLIELSFEQEVLMEDMKGLRGDDPRFNEMTKEQRAILESMKIVEDSLQELGKRIKEIEPVVNREFGKSKMNIDKALKAMTERKAGEMALHQQRSMTALNNLALLLDEIVDQLQKQMMQSMGQCQKPGSSKPSASSMQQLQKELNKQLEEMKKMMNEGKKDGKQNSGQKGSEAESLAKMAAQQAKIREELRKLEEGSSDKEAKELRKLGDLMEETERDIVNREISRETLLRQEKILTKLLESEKAERERDTDEKRVSEEGLMKKNGNLLEFNEYYNSRSAEHERLMKENITYRRYYKQKVEEYFKHLSK